MRSIIVVSVLSLVLTGCLTTKEQLYYETAKSISRDNTVSQTACWSAISDIAKGGSEGAKVGAIALAEKCKNETLKIEAPRRNWMGL
jgi:hypothetical protein